MRCHVSVIRGGCLRFPNRATTSLLQSVQAAPGAIQNPLSAAVPSASGPPRDRVAHAILRDARISPQKLDDFVRVIRRLHVDEALVQCQISVKKAAKLVHNVRPLALFLC